MSTTALTIHADTLTPLVRLVTDSVTSPHSRRAYDRALRSYLTWHSETGQAEFCRASVQGYRTHLEGLGLRPPSINQALSVIRKLASEAAEAGLLDEGTVASIQRLKGPVQRGARAGQWLTLDQSRALLAAPDAGTLRGLRDRALLGLLLGCGLRRAEASGLAVDQLQEREGRLCIVDLIRKRERIQTIPMPPEMAAAVRAWLAAAGLAEGRIFREVDKDGRVSGDKLSPAGIWFVVREYGGRIGMPELAPHSLRRTFAGLSLKGGATLRKIQQALGHASVQTTEKYLENVLELQNPACDCLNLQQVGG